jgi:hypothetical protein
VRFDDRLATVLGQSADSEAERQALWRQLVDLLAQEPPVDSASRRAAFARLRDWRGEMPDPVRLGAAAALVGQLLPGDLIAFFAEDRPGVAAPLLAAARAEDEVWGALMPALSPVARALLRHRRDLGPQARRALDAFGAADLALPAPPPSETAAEGPPVQSIAELVARIEAFKEARTPPSPPPAAPARPAAAPAAASPAAPAAPPTASVPDSFRFEAGPDGVIHWSDLDARGAVIGLSIAAADQTRAHGVDGHAAGAFRHRASFRDARLTIAGEGAAGGEWRISAVPVFDPASGRFRGYRGAARRPRLDERAELSGLFGTALPTESLRQLAHELRTPLNAIIGFAEMIDAQILGPVSREYRARAAEILDEARALLATIDDLETAARLDARALAVSPRKIESAALIATLAPALERLAEDRGARFRIELSPGLPPIEADPGAAERMFARLAGAILGLAEPGEAISARLDPGPAADRPSLRFTLARPARLAGRDEAALLDPAPAADGDWPDAPVLGLGFTLRLVRGLAEAAGGRLAIAADRFVLVLPAAAAPRSAAG